MAQGLFVAYVLQLGPNETKIAQVQILVQEFEMGAVPRSFLAASRSNSSTHLVFSPRPHPCEPHSRGWG